MRPLPGGGVAEAAVEVAAATVAAVEAVDAVTAEKARVVEPAEGAITFLYFPLLLVLAYAADIGYFSKDKKKRRSFGPSIIWAPGGNGYTRFEIRSQRFWPQDFGPSI